MRAIDTPVLSRHPSAHALGVAAIAFRFVHSADLHLDSPLRSMALRNPELAALIGTATRAALSRIVDLCLEEEVHALLIGGDLYDRAQTSMKTARALAEQLQRLNAANIPVLMIRGNHDAAARITEGLALPGNVHVFGARPGTRRLEGGGVAVAVHGVSFPARGAPRAPLHRFPAPIAGAINIGLLHTSLGGAPGHDPYAPVSLPELAAVGYDFWALGHLHARQHHPGPPVVLMPGMPQGRDIGESGPKSATLVRVTSDARFTLSDHPTALAEFARHEVDVSGAEDWVALATLLADALHAARAQATADHLVLRLRLIGGTPIAWAIRRDADALLEVAARRAPANTWIEGLSPACTPPATTDGGALDELARLLADPPAGLPAQAEALWDDILAALPAELRTDFPADPEAAAALRATLMADGIADVLARLHE